MVIAAVGDSITAGTPGYNPDPKAKKLLGRTLDERSQWEYWAQRQLGASVTIRNCGVPGERTDQIALRLAFCTQGADAVILEGGLNDLIQGKSVDSIVQNLQAMVRKAKAMGLRVGITELLPVRNPEPAFADTIELLNSRIEGIARTDGARLYRWYHLVEDPNQSGSLRADLTTDGLHPTVAGYRLLGDAITVPR
jgi:lysophospholipase L1-like esterase